MKTRKWAVIEIFVFILLLNPSRSFGQIVELPVTEIPQRTSSWCWAASMEMIIKYHNPLLTTDNNPFSSLPLTQCRLATNYFNLTKAIMSGLAATDIEKPIPNLNGCKCTTCESLLPSGQKLCDKGDKKIENFSYTEAQFIDFLFSYHWFHSNEDTSRMTWNDVKREIDNCRPFIAVVGFAGGGDRGAQHAVVIKGYEETATEKLVYIIDPLSPCIVGPPTPPCSTCFYKMSYDMFNLKWTTDTRKNRLIGFIHNIYPKRDTMLFSCDDSRKVKRQGKFRQTRIAQIKDSTNTVATNIVPVTVPVKYIDYDKMLNGNFGVNNIKPYLSEILTQEVITNDPPQYLSQEKINGEWKTLFVRDLDQIPEIIIKLDSCNQNICAVRLMNESYITDNLKVVIYEYVYYETIAQKFYRFNIGDTFYLAPVTDLRDPVTNKVIVKAGIALIEDVMISRLKAITKSYERDYLTKYKKGVEYTR
jgi:hypothetical protein